MKDPETEELRDFFTQKIPKRADGWPKWLPVLTEEDFARCQYCQENGYPKRCTAQMLFYLFGKRWKRSRYGGSPVEIMISGERVKYDSVLKQAFEEAFGLIYRSPRWRPRIPSKFHTKSPSEQELVIGVIEWNDSGETSPADQVELFKKLYRRLEYTAEA